MKSSNKLNDALGKSDEVVKLTKSQKDKVLKEHFELQISDAAISARLSKDFIKAAMLSWSYIEEYYLPTTIKYLAKFHKIPVGLNVIEKANVSVLINYYYLISHDLKLYAKLEEARKIRNSLVHKMYGSSAIEKIDEVAEKSARVNLDLITNLIWDREMGKVQYPSTMIAINARNDLRKEQRKRLDELLS